jgi:hypothetical protein
MLFTLIHTPIRELGAKNHYFFELEKGINDVFRVGLIAQRKAERDFEHQEHGP